MKTKARYMQEYSKEDLIQALKDALARRAEAIDTFEKDLARWREESPAKFAAAVEAYDPEKKYVHFPDFDPPKRSEACADWRIKDLNREIARIGLVAGDVIKLRQDDSIFGYIGEGACE